MSIRQRLAKAFGSAPFNMLRGIFPVSTGEPPVMGTEDLLSGYESMPWLRATAGKVATAVSMTDWRLTAVKRAGKFVLDQQLSRSLAAARSKALQQLRAAGELQEIQEHPFFDAITRPNPFMNRLSLMKISQIHADLVGDMYWLKERNGAGAPCGFWPVPPNWVMENPTPDRPAFRIGYRSWQVMVPAREVVWHHDPAAANPYTRGSGVGWSLGDELEVDEYAAKMAKQLFFNRARPDFVVMGGEGSSTTEMKRLEKDWLNRLQGFWRAHRPYFLSGKVDIHEFQQPTMEQLVYPGLRMTQRDIVLQTWGAPPEIFGILDSSNRATIEAAEYLFLKWVIAPRVESLRWTLQQMITEDYDPRLVLDYPSPVPEDKEFDLNVAKAAPWALGLDEWRVMGGRSRLGGDLGEARMVPLNSYLTGDPLDPRTRPATAAGGRPPGGEDEPREPKA